MSADEQSMFLVMTELLPVLQQYSDLKPKFLDIKVEKYKEGTIIKLKSDDNRVSSALADVLTAISKMNVDAKVTCKVEDYTK